MRRDKEKVSPNFNNQGFCVIHFICNYFQITSEIFWESVNNTSAIYTTNEKQKRLSYALCTGLLSSYSISRMPSLSITFTSIWQVN